MEYRPLSLCNTTYKIVSRCIVNRLKRVMDGVIDATQSAFIKGRLITDNIITGFECQHWMRSRKKGKIGYAALKTDMSKAYDRVEWCYVEAMMQRLGFPKNICDLIMECVTSVTFSILLNGRIYEGVKPERGIRQGDPLSPFLFVICAQGFSSMLTKAAEEGRVCGIPIVPKHIQITHLLFADDSILFFKASKECAKEVHEILKKYENASGQRINFDKSTITFSPNTQASAVHEVSTELRLKEDKNIQLYLGVPTFSIRQKKVQFGYIRDRVQKKIMEWNQHKDFSAGGNEILLKAVIQAIPTYTMQCFKIPMGICDDIHKMCASFWWGDKEERRRIHWTRWGTVCKRKAEGGLGFRDMAKFNLALLAKQLWRIITKPQLLIARVLTARYCRGKDVMDATVQPCCSYIWRSLMGAKEVLGEGLWWRIGDGKNIKVFKDKWVMGMAEGRVKGKEGKRVEEMTVNQLFSEKGEWDVEKIKDMFLPHEADGILNTAIGEGGRVDRRWWNFEQRGKYTVKSAYHSQVSNVADEEGTSGGDQKWWYKHVWEMRIPPRARVFIWRAMRDFLPTNANLKDHHVPSDGVCTTCFSRWAKTEHTLIYCPSVKNF